MSFSDVANKFLVDRVEFKLHAAEYHLNNLEEMERNHVDLSKSNIIGVEMEIDCFLAQIVAAIDAILVQINMILCLGITIEKVDIYSVQSALNDKSKNIDLLTELNQAANKNNWLWLLKELRDESMYRTLFLPMVDTNSSDERIGIFILKQQRKFTVHEDDHMAVGFEYFQESTRKVRKLVNSIRSKEAILKEIY